VLREERSTDGPKGKHFLEKVRSGAVQLATGLSTDIAAEVLVSLGRAFLGV
jgi:hypothetical protein